MIIGWNKKELLDLRSKYKLLLKNPSNETEELKIMDTIGSISAILESFNEPKGGFFTTERNNHKVTIETDLFFLRYYGLFAPFVRSFANESHYVNDHDTDLERIKDSSYRLISTISEFFDGTDIRFATKYKSLIAGDALRLRIVEGKKRETGCTFPILGTSIVYMYIGKVNSLQDYATLAHEMAHGISYYMFPDGLTDDDRMLYSEVISIFFETLANDFVSEKNGMQKDGLSVKIATYNDYLHTSRIICAMMDALSFLSGRELASKKKITSFLKTYDCCDDEDINFLLNNNISEMFKYVNSYLVAVELYLIYLEDRKRAFDLLEKITVVEICDPRKYLEYMNSLGIFPGANIEKYASLLSKEKGVIYDKKL